MDFPLWLEELLLIELHDDVLVLDFEVEVELLYFEVPFQPGFYLFIWMIRNIVLQELAHHGLDIRALEVNDEGGWHHLINVQTLRPAEGLHVSVQLVLLR